MSRSLTLCVVFAHPDDESFGTAGTLARYAARGVRTALISATRGEAGQSNGLADNPEALARLRSSELSCAAQAMGLSDLAVLDFPDGKGEAWDLAELAVRIAEVWARLAPDIVVTFDSAGVTRHPDHRMVHKAVMSLIAQPAQRRGIRRVYHQVVTCPEQASPEGPDLVCVSPEDVDVMIDIRAFEQVKRVALMCHRSQAADTTHFLNLPEGEISVEAYKLAWSADGQPVPAGTDSLFWGMEDGTE